MSKPILYGALVSPPVKTVLYTAKAIGLELEIKELDLHGKHEHLSEEFTKINPQHTVPTLVDNGVSIWDSNAIIMYLVDKYAKDDSLYPKDLAIRGRINQRLFFGAGTFDNAYLDVVRSLLRSENKPSDAQSEAILKQLDFLEKFLVDDYLVGNSVTIADLAFVLRIMITLRAFPVGDDKFPKLLAYLERMKSWTHFNDIEKAAEAVMDYIKVKNDLAKK